MSISFHALFSLLLSESPREQRAQRDVRSECRCSGQGLRYAPSRTEPIREDYRTPAHICSHGSPPFSLDRSIAQNEGSGSPKRVTEGLGVGPNPLSELRPRPWHLGKQKPSGAKPKPQHYYRTDLTNTKYNRTLTDGKA
ncbi:hypothetical protein BJV78DRAFT_1237560 [Lactifluus subvellereus]|nr:hypothetical protein BJV78DRAFT_1237560 [Lactifluus subvellereus]